MMGQNVPPPLISTRRECSVIAKFKQSKNQGAGIIIYIYMRLQGDVFAIDTSGTKEGTQKGMLLDHVLALCGRDGHPL